MKIKDKNRKVGRPKLADKSLKKESIIISIIILIMCIISLIFIFKSLTININPKYMVGTVYNDHIDSCIINNKSIQCGPNVTYMKYKTSLNDDYKEVIKQVSSIKEDLIDDVIEYCYKTNNTNLKCNN